MKSPSSLEQLFERYLNNEYSEADFWKLQAHFGSATEEERLGELVQVTLEETVVEVVAESAEERARIDRIAANIDAHMTQRFQRPRRLRQWFRAAVAAVFIAATAAAWVFFNSDSSAVLIGDGLASTEILPGGNRATLTLADGRTISLDEEQSGIVIGDEVKYEDGSAVFDSLSGKEIGDLSTKDYVLRTPKGGTYQVTLPDGSNVWLNAASTLRYPSRFDGEERVVFLEGEAFFEIKKQTLDLPTGQVGNRLASRKGRSAVSPLVSQQVPFKVQTFGQTVEVLGTEFNISAYADEDVTKTTLVKGLVAVRHGEPSDRLRTGQGQTISAQQQSITLSPGQQATSRTGLSGQGAQIEINEVNTESYTAWKDGRFHFDGEPIQAVMQKLVRWYDIEVEYRGEVTAQRFSGTMSRFDHIDQVLSKLSKTKQVQFKQEGRKIIVMP